MAASPLTDPQAPVQDVSQDVPDQIQAPAVPEAPQPAAPQPKQGLFHNLATGILQGLAMGGIPGAVSGGVDPNAAHVAFQQRKDMAKAKLASAQSTVKFQDAQAAETVANAHYRTQVTSQLPEQLRQQAAQLDLEGLKTFTNLGLQPSVVSDNSGAGATAGLEQLTKARGAVPSLLTFHVGDKIVGFDLSQVAQNSSSLGIINKYNELVGSPAVDAATYAKLPPQAKVKLLTDAGHFYSPIPATAEKADGQIEQYKNILARQQRLPDSPDKQENIDKLKGVVSYLQQAKAATVATKKDLATAPRVAGQNARAVGVTDAAGNTFYTSAGEAKARGYAPAAQGVKILPAQAQFKDIETGSQALRSSIQALPDTLSAGDVQNLHTILEADTPGRINVALKAVTNSNVSPAIRRAATAIAQQNERILSLRNVAGMGQGASDLRNALRATLPNAGSGSKKVMLQQLDASDQQVQALREGLPGLGRGQNTQQTNHGAAPKTNAAPQGRPVIMDGKVVGHTTDGKTMIPVGQ